MCYRSDTSHKCPCLTTLSHTLSSVDKHNNTPVSCRRAHFPPKSPFPAKKITTITNSLLLCAAQFHDAAVIWECQRLTKPC